MGLEQSRPTPEPERALSDAIADAVHTGEFDTRELRAAISVYVEHARAANRAPQEVLVELKTELQRQAAVQLEQEEFQRLSASIVRLGIDEYYREA